MGLEFTVRNLIWGFSKSMQGFQGINEGMLGPYVKGEVEVVVASKFFLVSYSWGEGSRTPSQKLVSEIRTKGQSDISQKHALQQRCSCLARSSYVVCIWKTWNSMGSLPELARMLLKSVLDLHPYLNTVKV